MNNSELLGKKTVLWLILLLALLLGSMVWAADKQRAQSDLSGQVRYMAAYDIITITANTAIAKGILAIVPETDVNVYFGTDTANDYLIKADASFAIHQDRDVKLKTNTVCLVF